MSHLVVGTAGHIDHGKTSMIRRLTGIDLDTLPEERERGITIALGFTPLVLDSGRRVAFVDVPGHERLVRTMIAGATGVDAVLLCVSAVDGVMPQTREHLAILDLLGVSEGGVVVTMADLVDEELLELAMEDVHDAVAGTFLEGKPMVAFSALEGDGVAQLRAMLDGFDAPAERAVDGPFRLPVDRAFVRQGFGTVVTGTAWSGSLPDGATVQLLPGDRTARIRGMQTHGESVERVQAGSRVALNLAGVEKDEVPRGTLIARGDVPQPLMIDVRYHHLPAAPALDDGAPVRVLLGTAERLGRLYLTAGDTLAPGASTFAQLRLDGPLPCMPGDRFVLRRTSPLETLGGGEVIDPWAVRMRHKNRQTYGDGIRRLAEGQAAVWLERTGENGLSDAEWAMRKGGDVGVVLGDRRLAAPVVARLEGALIEALMAYHSEAPLSLGAHRRELRRGRLGHLSERVFDALVDRLTGSKAVDISGPLVRMRGHSVHLTGDQEALRQALIRTVTDAGLAGLAPKALHKAHPEPEVAALLRLIESSGTLQQVPNIGWMATEALDDLRSNLRGWFSEHDHMDTGDFKTLTGLTRKTAIPLLEWLDKSRLTSRRGDERVPGSALG